MSGDGHEVVLADALGDEDDASASVGTGRLAGAAKLSPPTSNVNGTVFVDAPGW